VSPAEGGFLGLELQVNDAPNSVVGPKLGQCHRL
jgi:hypothetical protein